MLENIASIHRSGQPGVVEEPEPIAIIGIGCRLPGDVSSAAECWKFLQSGRDARCEFPRSRFNIDAFYSSKAGTPGTMPMRGGYFLGQDIRHFDNGFFNINNLEATYMDPQQRNLLEVVYECLESAGIRLEDIAGSSVGCYVADFVYDFLVMQAKDDEEFHRYSPTGKGRTILSNRISHALDLHGPSLTVDTACSSSLYCLHAACRALLQKDCDAAIVAAANLIQTPEQQMDVAASGVLSPTSTCHTFDAAADGYGRADAVGALYLKRLSDAIRDNDPIRSVIRATSTNSDGQTSGITLPSGKAQEAVIKKAYEFAKLDIGDTDYFECHGTGTPVGDVIEVAALSNVYSGAASRNDVRKLLIGSTKPSFGHSEAASGITSIIKATLALENLQIPPTVGIHQLNPKIPWSKHNVEVVRSLGVWPQADDAHIPRASVNSFGYGGANAHCILESGKAWIDRVVDAETPEITYDQASGQAFLLPLSARSANGLIERTRALADIDVIQNQLSDVAFTLATRRSTFQHRSFVVCRQSSWSTDSARSGIEAQAPSVGSSTLPLTFVFTGQGAQWAQMGQRLFKTYSHFRNTILKLECHLLSLPNSPSWSLSNVVFEEAGNNIHQPQISQTVCTAVQIALVDLLQAWGIQPDSVVGHSSGEIAAAYTAGHVSSTLAIEIAYLRGQAVTQNSNYGSMMAVSMAPSEAQELLEHHNLAHAIRIACYNSTESLTLSGDKNAIDVLYLVLQSAGKFARILNTGNQAYHSHHMRDVGQSYETQLTEAFRRDIYEKTFCQCKSKSTEKEVQMVSTVTGFAVSKSDTCNPTYWRNNLESPVMFSHAIQYLTKDQQHNFVEIGPHHAMKMPVQQLTSDKDHSSAGSLYLSALVRNKCSETTALSLAGSLWSSGYEVDFEAIRKSYRWSSKAKPRVLHDLPNYPWDHSKMLWKESRLSTEYRNRKYPRDELIGSRLSGSSRSATWRGLLDVSNIAWIMDHRIGNEIVLPGACYISMAARACQQLLDTSTNVSVLELRNVEIEKVMLLVPESRVEVFTELRPLKLSSIQDASHVWEFTISSMDQERSIRHASGCIEAFYSATSLLIPNISIEPALESQSNRLWYSQFLSNSLNFGPSFQSMSSVQVPRLRQSMSAEADLQSLADDVLNEHRLLYPFDVHPIITDAAFQTGLVATVAGDLEQLSGQVPVSIERLQIFRHTHDLAYSGFRTRAVAKAVGPGVALGRCELIDPNGQKALQVHNVKVAPLREKAMSGNTRTPILKSVPVPDLSLVGNHNVEVLTTALPNIQNMLGILPGSDIASIVAIKAMLSPELKVLQIGNLDVFMSLFHTISILKQSSSSNLMTYTFGLSRETGDVLCLDIKDWSIPDTAEFETRGLSLDTMSTQYDVVIFNHSTTTQVKSVAKYVKTDGLILEPKTASSDHGSDSGIFMDDLSYTSDKDYVEIGHGPPSDTEFKSVHLTSSGENEVLGLTCIRPKHNNISQTPIVIVVGDMSAPINVTLLQRLRNYNPQTTAITFNDLEANSLPPRSAVLVTAELNKAIVANANPEQFSKIQMIANAAAKVIWITESGYSSPENPEQSTILGLSRSVMASNPAIQFAVLDIDNSHLKIASTCTNILAILDSVLEKSVDLEYSQKDGLLYVNRMIPAESCNEVFELKKKSIARLTKLSDTGNCELHIREPGQFDTLEFRSLQLDAELPADYVDITVQAVSMNAKDLYTLSGKVDTVENTCSCEFSGVVKAVGSAVTSFSIGDKVVSSSPGRYRSVERIPASVCLKLNEEEDLTEMAAVPMVYGTAIHALRNLANLQSEESVLIHSAAGGVGTAAILLAKRIGANIFTTVGNDKKKEYLVDQFGLDPNQVFNSRDTSFLPAILAATNGTGVDVVLNSLTGSRLHASLDACAKFGRFVEIGKRDILDAGNLNMKVFAKGITFSAFDLHELFYSSNPRHRRIYEKLLVDAVEFYRSLGYTGGASTAFDISNIGDAFRHFANASRIGKVVVTYNDPSSLVPLVSPKFTTRFSPDKSYLLVGCLGGLGRSVSRYMLRNGARHFTFLGRSGASRPAAAMLVSDLEQAGADITVVTGDVCSMADVEKAVSTLAHPLGGVVQAAMGLSEALFPAMTHEAWHTALDPKIRGTWNLHRAIKAHEDTLDFFLLTSSISGTIGFSTEPNYCAANCFLDHFASFRRRLGLKATSVALGPVAGAGIVHEHPEIENVFFRGGITEVSEDDMLCMIDIGLSQQHEITHLITGLEPQRAKPGFENSWEMLAPDPRLSHITAAYQHARSSTNTPTQSRSSTDPRLSSLLDEAAKTKTSPEPSILDSTLHAILAEQLGKLVLLDASKIGSQMYLADVGMDSTLAAQFRTYIFRATAVDVSFVMLMDAKTRVADLVGFVAEAVCEKAKA